MFFLFFLFLLSGIKGNKTVKLSFVSVFLLFYIVADAAQIGKEIVSPGIPIWLLVVSRNSYLCWILRCQFSQISYSVSHGFSRGAWTLSRRSRRGQHTYLLANLWRTALQNSASVIVSSLHCELPLCRTNLENRTFTCFCFVAGFNDFSYLEKKNRIFGCYHPSNHWSRCSSGPIVVVKLFFFSVAWEAP